MIELITRNLLDMRDVNNSQHDGKGNDSELQKG